MQLYYDGAAIGTPTPLVGTMLSGAAPTRIGVGTSSGQQFFLNGNVSEVAVYNVGLTPTEISNIYNNGANTVTRGAVSYHRLTEGSGTTTKDSVGTNDGTLVNVPLWSSDMHLPLPNSSIFPMHVSDPILKIKSVVRSVSETASVVDSKLRRVIPFIRDSVFVDELLLRLRIFTINERPTIAEGSGFTSGFTGGFATIPGVLRNFIPKITTQSSSVADSTIRVITRKIATQTATISELLKGLKTIFINESASDTDSLVRKVTRKIATQTGSVSDVLTRKPIPKITTQTVGPVSDSIARLVRPFISQTVSVSDLIKRLVPRAISQSASVSDSTLRKPIPNITSQTASVADSLKRPFIRRALSEAASVTENLLRRVIPMIVTQTASLADSIAAHKLKVKTLLESASISDSIKRAPVVRKIAAQTQSTSDSLLRLVIPKITTQTISVADSKIRNITRALLESITDADSKVRKIIPKITTQTISASDALTRPLVARKISEAASAADSIVRVVARKLSESASNAQSILRKPIRRITTDSAAVSDAVSRVSHFVRTITQTQSTADQLATAVRRFYTRALNEAAAIASVITRKPIPNIATQAISTAESTIQRLVTRKQSEAPRVNDSVFAQQPHSPIVSSTGAGFGWAGGGGNRLDRPIPIRFFVRDWRFGFRKRMKQ
jgi:hypothetical protein